MYVAALIFCPVTVPLVAVRFVGPRWGHSVPPCCLARRASTPERGNVTKVVARQGSALRATRATGTGTARRALCRVGAPPPPAPLGRRSVLRQGPRPRNARAARARPLACGSAPPGRRVPSPSRSLRAYPCSLVRRGLSLRRSAPSLRVRVPRPRRKVTVRVSGGLRLRARAKAALNAGRKSAAPCAPLRRPLYSI